MAKSTNRKKKAESVAETLCSFNRFLCDIVISIYMVVILAVLPLYNKGYAQIGTEKENFFLKTMTYAGKFLLPVFLLWLLFAVAAMIQKKELLKKNMLRQLPEIVWREFGTTDKFAFAYGIAVILSYAFTNYRDEALWGPARVDELARMMAGAVVTEGARATAREMLAARHGESEPEAKGESRVAAKGERPPA